MGSFDVGRVLGSFLMTFAVFVIVQYCLARIPGLRSKYATTGGIAFVLCVIILVATPAPIEVIGLSLTLFVIACAWHWKRSTKKASS